MNGKVMGGFSEYELGNGKVENDRSFIFSLSNELDFNLKVGKKATVIDKLFGPIFGNDSDFKIRDRKITTNYHMFNSGYEKR